MGTGYSAKPLHEKLGIRGDLRVLLIDAPEGFGHILGDPAGPEEGQRADVIVWFVVWRRELESGFSEAIERLADRGGLWIAWPKRASGRTTDLTEGTLRDVLLPTGLVDNKVCAIDETWSGLRFVRRRS